MNEKQAKVASRTLAAVALAALAACATPPTGDKELLAEFEQINDPLEPTNRVIFQFNQGVDTIVLRPAAEAYRTVVPEFGRDRVGDFLDNLYAPLTFVHDVLQGDLGRAGTTLGRFVMNTTFGVFGIMDVAGPAGLAYHYEDAGQTLGVWGAPEGAYLMLPVLGPSNPRDLTGRVADWVVDPFQLATRDADWARWGRTGGSALDQREKALDVLDDLEKTSLDYYAAVRSLYRQRRDTEIRNGKAADSTTPGLTK